MFSRVNVSAIKKQQREEETKEGKEDTEKHQATNKETICSKYIIYYILLYCLYMSIILFSKYTHRSFFRFRDSDLFKKIIVKVI